jgi:hypothetical protein
MIWPGWLGSVPPVTECLSTPSTYQLIEFGCQSMVYVWKSALASNPRSTSFSWPPWPFT